MTGAGLAFAALSGIVARVVGALGAWGIALVAIIGWLAAGRASGGLATLVLSKALRTSHPALMNVGERSADVKRTLGSMATILDALNPVRNNASVAHPNKALLGEPEATLVHQHRENGLGELTPLNAYGDSTGRGCWTA